MGITKKQNIINELLLINSKKDIESMHKGNLAHTTICFETCDFYKDCVDSIMELDEIAFIEYYIKSYKVVNIDNSATKKIEEYINNRFNSKNIFFGKLIKYIKNEFFKESSLVIPREITNMIIKNNDFCKFILTYIHNSNSEIINNSSLEYFQEINFLLYLSGMNKNYDISLDSIYDNSVEFDKSDSTNSILGLLNYYNNLIEHYMLKDDNGTISIIIHIIIDLFEIINNALLVGYNIFGDSMNISYLLLEIKKKIIKTIELIGNIEKDIKLLNLLNNIDGKIDLIFSHIILKKDSNKYIEDLNCPKILANYKNSFSEIINGYKKMKESNFGDGKTDDKNAYKAFLGNSSILILEMFELLDKGDEKELLKNNDFKEILSMYFTAFPDKNDKIIDIETFRLDLIHNFFLIYKGLDLKDEKNHILKEDFLETFINDFTGEKELNQYEIESLYDVIRFSNLDKDLLLKVGECLMKSHFNSHYYEEFKIKVIIIIIESLSGTQNSEFEVFLSNLIIYIETYTVASYLLISYSEIYLYISLYYSYCLNYDSQKNAIKYYYKFKQIRDDEYINNYKLLDIYSKITYNIGSFEPKIDGYFENLTESKVRRIGMRIFRESEKLYYEALEKDIDNQISLFMDENLNSTIYSDSSKFILTDKITQKLSVDLFRGLCEVSIYHDTDKKIENKKGYKYESEILYDGYKIYFKYPIKHRDIFNKIYTEIWPNFIKGIRNTLMIYIQKREIEIEPITGFYNDTKIQNISSKNELEEHSLIIFRISNIKDITEGYGYEAGSEYIKAIGNELKKILSDIVIEFYKGSGSTFSIHLKKGLSKDIIEKYFLKIDKMQVTVKGIFFPISVKHKSGIALNEKGDFYKLGHIAYNNFSKDNMTNHSYYDKSLVNSAKNRNNIETLSNVSLAIEEGRVMAFLQPIIDIKTGNIYKYESLVRIIDKSGDIILPYKFIPFLDEIGESWSITKIMIDKAFKRVHDKNISISVNISGLDLLNKKFMALLNEKISQFNNIDNSKITFEILESQIFGDYKDKLISLKSMGFKIAMDDYGSDASSIKRFLELTKSGLLDYVKLDGDIVKPLISGQGFNTVKGIIEDCHKAGIKVIAEFVSDEQILTVLNLMGVDFGQGYHFSTPLHPDEV